MPKDQTHSLHDGLLQLFLRNGLWQARVYLGDGRYLWRSLKTVDFARAKDLGTQLFYETQFKLKAGLPTHQRSFLTVINEYVAWRERDNAQGRAAGNSTSKFTSDAMLRQVQRVAKFWRAYAGNRAIEVVDDKVLSGYVNWRKAYYQDMPELPKNARLHPADKTLQWEIMLGKAIIKFAHDAGYRGNKPLPTFTFVPKVKRVRPAFTIPEYRALYRAMRAWILEADNPRSRYTRQLLRDYVLVLANSGIRVGEANNLRVRDVVPFVDALGRHNVELWVKGKTGHRVVIPRVAVAKYIARVLALRDHVAPDDLVFVMQDGGEIITLIDQFNTVLTRAGILTNSAGDKFTLYSLRHFYAVMSIRSGIDIYMISRNMGTSVAMIEAHYGKSATPAARAAQLGGQSYG
jgi:integrase